MLTKPFSGLLSAQSSHTASLFAMHLQSSSELHSEADIVRLDNCLFGFLQLGTDEVAIGVIDNLAGACRAWRAEEGRLVELR